MRKSFETPLLLVLTALLAGAPVHAARWGGFRGSAGAGRAGAGRSGAVTRAPSSSGMAFTRNSGVTRGIVSQQRTEVVPNHYYYHNAGGVRYWHYYHGGLHWYGFYFGPRFFWFPYWGGYWWWYDVNEARWAFWWDGYWWWEGPGGALYIDVDGNYVPYDQYESQAQSQQEQAGAQQQGTEQQAPQPPSTPPSAPPSTAAAASNAPAEQGSAWTSPDGKRMVQIVGPTGMAYLYDESQPKPVLLKPLTGNVDSVKFSGGKNGQPVQILLELKDGSFAVYDANGEPMGAH